MVPRLPSAFAIAVALALGLPVTAPAQQVRLKSGVLRAGPLPNAVVRPMPRPQAEIVLRDVPDDMLTVMQDPDWPNPRRTAGTWGVSRQGLPLRTCRQPADSIDLRRLRAHGFHVVGYALNNGSGPQGFKVAGYSNVRPFKYASPDSDRLLNAHDPAEIDRISVSPQVWVLDVPVRGKMQRMGCASTWTLDIRVVGPKGINPYTGQPQ